MSDWWGGDWTQNRRIRELEDDLAAARSYASSQSSRMRRELTSLRGDLEGKLNRLVVAFDNFVELSDLREELASFADQAEVRRRARHLVAGLTQRATDPSIPPPPPVVVDDVPGYWLVPAIDALAALVREDMATADKAVAQALERDHQRTTAFLVLGLTAAGQPAGARPWIEDTFPPIGTTTTRLQRLLWQECAQGTYGDEGRALAARRVRELVGSCSPDQVRSLAEPWRTALPAYDRSVLPEALRDVTTGRPSAASGSRAVPALAVPRHGARQLAALEARCREALDDQAGPGTDADPDPGPAAQDPTGGHQVAAELIRSLIDEGYGDERPLLQRAAELRRALEDDVPDPPRWDAEAGDAATLMAADIAARAPGLRSITVRACGPAVLHLADELAAAVAAPIPDEVVVRAHGTDVRIGPGGADTTALAQAHSRIDDEVPTRMTRPMAVATALGGLALVVVGAVALAWFVALVGIALGAAAVHLWFQANREKQQDEAWAQGRHDELDQRIRATTQALTDYATALTSERQEAVTRRANLTALFD